MKLMDLRERFLRDLAPVRLGNLASSLAQLASCAARPVGRGSVPGLLEECRLFAEWAMPEADGGLKPALSTLKDELTAWLDRWAAGGDDAARGALSVWAREASDRILESSGLLDPK